MKKLIPIALLFLASCASSSEDKSNMAYVISQDFVKKSLKSPDHADFPFTPVSEKAIVKKQTYYIRSYVNAKNSYNADLKTEYNAILKFKGGEEGDPKNWEVLALNFNN